MLLTRPPLELKTLVRLACVRHTASVHPEPGSNSLKISLNFYLLDLFGFRQEMGGLLVLLVFLLPLLIAFSMGGQLVSSVDFYYRIKSFGLRLRIFNSFLNSGFLIKDWSLFLILIVLYL